MSDDYYLSIIKNSDLAQRSKQIYLTNIPRVQSFYGNKSIDYVVKHPNEFIEKMTTYADNEKLGIDKRDQFVRCIYALFKYADNKTDKQKELMKEWEKISQMTQKPIKERVDKNEPSERQLKAFVSWDDLIKLRDQLPKGSDQRLLFCVYSMIPPIRNNFWSMLIYEAEKDRKQGRLPEGDGEAKDITENYLLTKDKVIILQTYKTSKKYGNIKIDIPDDLYTEIVASLKDKPRNYLFTNYRNNPYITSDSFDKWANNILKDITQKPDFTLTMFRHIYLSRGDLHLWSKTGAERRQIAEIMGHQLNTQFQYMWLNDQNRIMGYEEI
jgi:integrase